LDSEQPIGAQKEDPQTCDLFISYSRRDNETGRITELKERIEADYLEFTGEPLQCFFDVGSIHGMDDWRHRILQALRDSQLLLLVLSPNYLASEYCQWEIVEYLKYEHSRAAAGQGVAPVYFVEVPGLDSPDFDEQAADWIAQIRRRNHFDLRPWHEEGSEALKRLDVAKRLDDLEQTLYRQISKLRRVAEAQGNLAGHNPYFVGRETEMQQLHEATGLGRFGVLSIIQGVGGLGKTALAIQYAYAYADFYSGGRWLIPCASKRSLASAIRDLSIDLGITFEQAEKDDDELAAKRVLAELERRALEGAEARAGEKTPPQPRTLLLLDNVEVGDMLQPPQTDLISGKRWLHIVATTRLSDEEFGHDPDLHNLLTVDELPLEDAVRLLERHMIGEQFPNEAERRAAEQIAEVLGGFTLAVEVAANYLGERRGRVTCSDFLQRLRKEGFDQVAPDARRSVRHGEKLVGATLEPTLALLKPAESLVLSYAALLPPDLIPLPWLRPLAADEYPGLGVDAEPGYDDPWLDLVNHLLGLRLLQVVDLDPDTGAPRLVRMHRLTGETVRAKKNLSEEHQLERLIFHAVARSSHLSQTWFKPDSRWEVEPLVSFADILVSLEHKVAPKLVTCIGEWHEFSGDPDRSLALHRGAIKILESRQPCDEFEIAILKNNLALLLQALGKLDEAESNFRETLNILRKALPAGHLHIAITLTNLAVLLQALGRLDEAELLNRDALVLLRKILPPGHIDIASGLNNLATLLQALGKLDEAEPIFREALEIMRKALPPEHPHIALNLSNLATLLQTQGKLDEAEPIFREALEIMRKALPPEHPHIALNLSNLATLLQTQGMLDEAEPICREALEIRRKVLPPGHSDIANSLTSLAMLFQAQGKLDEAEVRFREALEIRRKALPPEHPDIANNLNNLAALLQARGKLDEAEPLFREALETQRKVLPLEHPDIALNLNDLALLLHIRGKLDEAESHNREALEIQRKTLRPMHPDIAISLNNLALILRDRSMHEEAATMLREAIEIEEASLSEAHPKRPHRLNNLTMVLMLGGNLEEAATVNAEAWRLKCIVTEGGHDVTSGRILFVRTVLSWLIGTNPAALLGRLKTLLAREELPAHGNISIRWDVADVLEQLRSRLPEKEKMDLLIALVDALNDHSYIVDLDQSPLWRNQPQVSLDVPLDPISK